MFHVVRRYDLPNSDVNSCGYEALSWWFDKIKLDQFHKDVEQLRTENVEEPHNYSTHELLDYCKLYKLPLMIRVGLYGG